MPDFKNSIMMNPIGFFNSKQIEPYQAARQPDELSEPGEIILNEKNNFEQALLHLNGCSHIWIIYYFHHNQNWKPQVLTPRSSEKIGVFSTRAPYRPNPIGLTVVKIISIDGLKITVGPNDILNGTPILDIKPYHSESDIIEDSKIAWLDISKNEKYEIQFSPFSEKQIEFLNLNGLNEISTFIKRQLEYDPTNSNKKRVEKINEIYTLSYRTWRIDFIITENLISILSIRSGYSEHDLKSDDDKYFDKNLHKKYISYFS